MFFARRCGRGPCPAACPARQSSITPILNTAVAACWPPWSRSPASVYTNVHAHRTKREYPQFRQQLAGRYPHATKIQLVQDNLNTHALSTFYDCLPAAMAHRLAERFEVYYTPKCGSWLNQIELDFSALSRQCLKRRIPTQAQLA